jgi:hypothetical protein
MRYPSASPESEMSEVALMWPSSPPAAPIRHNATPAQIISMPLASSGWPGCGARLA